MGRGCGQRRKFLSTSPCCKRERMKKGEKGFTLIELLITLAVIGILAAFAAPAYKDWMQNVQCREAARSIAALLLEARAKAISTNSEHKVNIQPTAGRFQIYRGNRSFNSSLWPKPFPAVSLPENVFLKHGDACDQTGVLDIYFYPNGSASSDATSSAAIPDLCIFERNGIEKLKVKIPFPNSGRVVIQ